LKTGKPEHLSQYTVGTDVVYRAVTKITTVSRESARYKLDLVGIQEFRWDKGGTVREGVYIFCGKGNENHQLGTEFVLHIPHSIVSAVYREYSLLVVGCHIVLRGRWCNIIVLNCMHQVWRRVMVQKTDLIRN
jgi:hypothetical protein